MPWSSSNRASRLPRSWGAIRSRVLRRDGHRCVATMLDGSRCVERAIDVDHIVPGDDHRFANLQSLCGWHHKQKTGAESAAARRRHPRERRARPAESHPGLL